MRKLAVLIIALAIGATLYSMHMVEAPSVSAGQTSIKEFFTNKTAVITTTSPVLSDEPYYFATKQVNATAWRNGATFSQMSGTFKIQTRAGDNDTWHDVATFTNPTDVKYRWYDGGQQTRVVWTKTSIAATKLGVRAFLINEY